MGTSADYPRFAPLKSKQIERAEDTFPVSVSSGIAQAVIFQRALLREFGNLALAVFATLFAITLTTQLIRLLGQAAGGKLLSPGPSLSYPRS